MGALARGFELRIALALLVLTLHLRLRHHELLRPRPARHHDVEHGEKDAQDRRPLHDRERDGAGQRRGLRQPARGARQVAGVVAQRRVGKPRHRSAEEGRAQHADQPLRGEEAREALDDVEALELRLELLRRDDAARLHDRRHGCRDRRREHDGHGERDHGGGDGQGIEGDRDRRIAGPRNGGAQVAARVRGESGDGGRRERDRTEERDGLAGKRRDGAVALLLRLA